MPTVGTEFIAGVSGLATLGAVASALFSGRLLLFGGAVALSRLAAQASHGSFNFIRSATLGYRRSSAHAAQTGHGCFDLLVGPDRDCALLRGLALLRLGFQVVKLLQDGSGLGDQLRPSLFVHVFGQLARFMIEIQLANLYQQGVLLSLQRLALRERLLAAIVGDEEGAGEDEGDHEHKGHAK